MRKKRKFGLVRQMVRSMQPMCRACGRPLNLSEVVDELFARLPDELLERGWLNLPGLGVLEVVERKGRYILPVDGKKQWVPDWLQTSFRASTQLKKRLRELRGAQPSKPPEPEEKAQKDEPTIPATPAERRSGRQRYRARPGDNPG